MTLPINPTPTRLLRGHKGVVSALAFSPDGVVLASGSYDKTVRLWDAHTGKLLCKLEGHGGKLYSIAYSPGGGVLACGGYHRPNKRGEVSLWSPVSGTLLGRDTPHANTVNALVFAPDEPWFATASWDGSVGLWDTNLSAARWTTPTGGPELWCVAFSPDGQLLAAGSSEGEVRVQDSGTGDERCVIAAGGACVYDVAFSPDGKLLATGTRDGCVRLWDPLSGALIDTLTGPTNYVVSLAFHPGGELIAGGTSNGYGSVFLWNIKSGSVQQIPAGDHLAFSVVFSPDGGLLASGNQDRKVRIWELQA